MELKHISNISYNQLVFVLPLTSKSIKPVNLKEDLVSVINIKYTLKC